MAAELSVLEAAADAVVAAALALAVLAAAELPEAEEGLGVPEADAVSAD